MIRDCVFINDRGLLMPSGSWWRSARNYLYDFLHNRTSSARIHGLQKGNRAKRSVVKPPFAFQETIADKFRGVITAIDKDAMREGAVLESLTVQVNGAVLELNAVVSTHRRGPQSGLTHLLIYHTAVLPSRG